jgi:aminoglycoside phosphotransferase (APT) family kinase protein
MMEEQRELLARQLSGLGEQVSYLEREVADLRRRVESLEGPAPDLDPAAAWLEQHPEEVARHRGKQVAIHPKLGIVASADNFAELYTRGEAPRSYGGGHLR